MEPTLSAVRTGLMPDGSLLIIRTYSDNETTAELYTDGVGSREVTLTAEYLVGAA